eukprot:272395_1
MPFHQWFAPFIRVFAEITHIRTQKQHFTTRDCICLSPRSSGLNTIVLVGIVNLSLHLRVYLCACLPSLLCFVCGWFARLWYVFHDEFECLEALGPVRISAVSNGWYEYTLGLIIPSSVIISRFVVSFIPIPPAVIVSMVSMILPHILSSTFHLRFCASFLVTAHACILS